MSQNVEFYNLSPTLALFTCLCPIQGGVEISLLKSSFHFIPWQQRVLQQEYGGNFSCKALFQFCSPNYGCHQKSKSCWSSGTGMQLQHTCVGSRNREFQLPNSLTFTNVQFLTATLHGRSTREKKIIGMQPLLIY